MSLNSQKSGTNRRSFLKWTSAGVAASLFPLSFRRLGSAEAAQLTDYLGGAWVPSCCNMCGGQCGIWGYVKGGTLQKIEPTSANPYGLTDAVNPNNVANVNAPTTALGTFSASGRDAAPLGTYSAAIAANDVGRLCCKGNSALKSVYDPDRLKTPMKRVGPRGSNQFVPISWEQALEECAQNLGRIKNTHGARSIVWFGEDHSFTHIQQDIMDGLGSPNYHNHSNLCDTSRKAHYLATIGADRPLADFENADFVLVWGWNFLSALKWIHLAAIFSRGRRDRSFKFVYVDPVFNTTASRADQWIAPRPGSDGALALALAKELLDYDAGTGSKYDRAFVDQFTTGLTAYRAYLDGATDGQPKDAAWGAAQSGVAAATITALAHELGDAYAAGKRICIDTWSGPGHHTNATQGGRAINCLNLLLGGVDRPGTLVIPQRNGPGRLPAHASWKDASGKIKYDGWRLDGRDDVTINGPATSNRDLVDSNGVAYPAGTTIPVGTKFHKKYAISHGSGIYVEARESMINQRDFLGVEYPVKAAVFVFQNFLMSTPNTYRNMQALNMMDFIMCLDTHMSETAQFADIVIPGSSFLERYDYNANWGTFRSIGLRQPVIDSWIGGMSEAQFLMHLGSALGIGGFDAANYRDVDERLTRREWEIFRTQWSNQMDFDTLKQKGVWIESGSKGGTRYHKYASSFSLKYDSKWMHVEGTAAPYEVRLGVSGPGGLLIGTASAAVLKDGDSFTIDSAYAGGGYQSAFMHVDAVSYGGDPRYLVRSGTTSGSGVTLGIGSATLANGQAFPVGFSTETKFGQFWSKNLNDYFVTGSAKRPAGASVVGDDRYHPLPFYLAPEDGPTPEYPLYFVSWKEVEHTHTRTFNNPWLMEMKGENKLYVHPSLADSLGLDEDDLAWVETPVNRLRVRIHRTPGIHYESTTLATVGFVRGFGHWALGETAKGRGAHDGWILPGKAEIHSGQAVHKEVPCRIYKARF
ncbi:MAG: molybdopterin-dependent oxidoreductase [Deltaproteobacteria bacterium]|nr:molybdopterin-dependent oxidoreductase [Deltaproteobacteria bacterium]